MRNPARRLLPFLIIPVAAAIVLWRTSAAEKPVAHGRSGPKKIPVVVEKAVATDVPVWTTGLGTVQAFNTVTVRPRVSGALDKVEFTEGQPVKAGDVLAQIDARPYRWALEQARAKLAQDSAILANAKLELDRTRGLVETQAESRQLLDQKESTVAQAAAAVQADEAALEAAKLNVEFTTIRAPISGRTGVRQIDAGNLVTANQETGLVVLTQIQPVSVVFTIPQQQLATLAPHLNGGGAPLSVEAVNDDGKLLAQGRLELIDNQIDPSTGTLRLKATFPNDPPTLWPGQFVNTRIRIRTLDNVVTVATESVRPGIDGPFVYVVRKDGTVEARRVKPGYSEGGRTVVTDGLAAGELVVREGHNKLEPGAAVVVATNAEP